MDNTPVRNLSILGKFPAIQKNTIAATLAIAKNFPRDMASTAPSLVVVAVASIEPVDDVEGLAPAEDTVPLVFVALALDDATVLATEGAAVAEPEHSFPNRVSKGWPGHMETKQLH